MKKLFFLLLLHLPFFLSAQVESVVVQWDETPSQPFFPDGLYADGENTLPYLTRKILWDTGDAVPRARVTVTETAPLAVQPDPMIPTANVGKTPRVKVELVREKGQPYAVVSVRPFIRSGDGTLQKVVSFRIELEPEMALAPLKSAQTGQWSDHSVLASGEWFRIAVEQSGIHKLTYQQLVTLGLPNPATVRIYGSGARLLPENFSEGYIDDLRSVPFHMAKGSDGLFGPGDYILFYAQGPVAWEYDTEEAMFLHDLHTYSWKGYYFLTSGQGEADGPETTELSSEPATETVTGYDFLAHREDETYNLIKSGKEWFGDNFNVNLEEHYPFALPGRITGEAARIRIIAAARSGVTSTFSALANNQPLGSIECRGTNLSNYTATFAYEGKGLYSHVPGQDNLTVTLKYNRPDSNSEGWLNAITLNARAPLQLRGSQTAFRDMESVGTDRVSEFRVSGSSSTTVVWEITDPGNPKRVPHTLQGSEAVFRLSTDQLREFIAFNPGGEFPAPEIEGDGLGAVPNQDLHGLGHPDMVIITPEVFLEQAQRLAEHRTTLDGMEVAVVLQQQVFNEFSSGTPDVSAIRNFMKMFYDRAGGAGEYCRYLLLFGDGSYDNRNRTPNNPNLILTYQSDNSLSPVPSYVSDDFFGLLDTDESMITGLLDIGIGRLPASTVEEAEELVDKIIGYSEPDRQGEWRNVLCFIGDDEDNNVHMRQADELATYVKTRYPAYNINKIYLDAYPQENLATGPRYPDVTRAINDQVNRGALIVNYTGHGGPNGLAHEKIMTTNDILSWSNAGRLPLFMTATCEFSRYDEYDHKQDQEITSAGEEVLLSPAGGGIALFTTTRLVYSGPNHELNEKFYEVVFEKDGSGESNRLGDIILYSKNNTGSGINKRNFTLLGDPSMKLVYPQQRVVTDSINGVDIAEASDTLSAFQWVTVSGHLETQGGAMLESFNGTVYPLVFDKEKLVETLQNDGGREWSFYTRNNILYSGKTTVKDGRFSFGFFVPKDINYAFGSGKISYYSNNSEIDAHGSWEGFAVGGIGSDNASDTEPPRIELYMNDTLFVPGGITDPHPTLLVQVSDNFGINTTGNGIGHDLTATLDGDRARAVILNEFFQANTDSYNSGTIRYPYSNLEEGRHRLAVKIWDIHNNSAESELEFVVVESEEMLLKNLFNFPNPFFEETFFSVEHNRPDREMRLVIKIYTLNGEMVRILDRQIFSPGYRLEPVQWDGTSAGGQKLGGGIYLYNATLRTEEGEVASESGKLLITR